MLSHHCSRVECSRVESALQQDWWQPLCTACWLVVSSLVLGMEATAGLLYYSYVDAKS